MNADELRAVQAPLKERYRQQPAAALITLKAEGHMSEGVTCKIETGKALVAAGLHPATAEAAAWSGWYCADAACGVAYIDGVSVSTIGLFSTGGRLFTASPPVQAICCLKPW